MGIGANFREIHPVRAEVSKRERIGHEAWLFALRYLRANGEIAHATCDYALS